MFVRPRNPRSAFTLVELVVVVIIIGIIAAVAAPRFLDKTDEAKAQVTLQKAAVLRNAIELYRADKGSYPTAAKLATEILPYLKGAFPKAQFKTLNSAAVTATTSDPPTAVVTGGSGWLYNASNGGIWVNDADLMDGSYDKS